MFGFKPLDVKPWMQEHAQLTNGPVWTDKAIRQLYTAGGVVKLGADGDAKAWQQLAKDCKSSLPVCRIYVDTAEFDRPSAIRTRISEKGATTTDVTDLLPFKGGINWILEELRPVHRLD